MDNLTFVSKVLEALAWPVAAITLAFVFRSQIKMLISIIKKVKAGPIEAEFDRDVRELRVEVETQLPPKPLSPAAVSQQEKLFKLAQINARSAIIEAWQGVEFAARRSASRRDMPVRSDRVTSPLSLVRYLQSRELLTPEEVALFGDLRALRNEAVHTPDFSPSQEAVTNYIELSSRLQAALEKAGA